MTDDDKPSDRLGRKPNKTLLPAWMRGDGYELRRCLVKEPDYDSGEYRHGWDYAGYHYSDKAEDHMIDFDSSTRA